MEFIMSLSKIWKLALASLCAISLAACVGSHQGGSESYDAGESSEESEGGSTKAQKVDEDELKKTQDAAVKVTEENHELRRQIFEAKTQLGISTQTQTEETATEEAADAQ